MTDRAYPYCFNRPWCGAYAPHGPYCSPACEYFAKVRAFEGYKNEGANPATHSPCVRCGAPVPEDLLLEYCETCREEGCGG